MIIRKEKKMDAEINEGQEGQEASGCEDTDEANLKALCDGLRNEIQRTARSVKVLLEHSDMKAENEYPGQRGEMKANVMLTYRHLEDARMRVGKILQAAGDGVSILDK